VKSVSHTSSSRRLPVSSRPCTRRPSDHVSHFSRHLLAALPSYPSMTIWRPSLHTVHKLSAYYLVRVYQLQSARRSVAVLYGVPFPPKFNVPFYIVLYTIYPTFCVCHLSLHSRFNFFAFNIQL